MIAPFTTDGRHRTNAVSFAFLAHLLRRAASFLHYNATASFTNRKVSSQSEQPAVKTSIFLFFLPFQFTSFCRLCPATFPCSNTLSSVLAREFAKEFSVLLCFRSQHVFTSLPVRVHTSFGEAADATPATVIAANSAAILQLFSSIHLLQLFDSSSTPWSRVQGQPLFRNFAATDLRLPKSALTFRVRHGFFILGSSLPVASHRLRWRLASCLIVPQLRIDLPYRGC